MVRSGFLTTDLYSEGDFEARDSSSARDLKHDICSYRFMLRTRF
jgi:hypothetical protein